MHYVVQLKISEMATLLNLFGATHAHTSTRAQTQTHSEYVVAAGSFLSSFSPHSHLGMHLTTINNRSKPSTTHD